MRIFTRSQRAFDSVELFHIYMCVGIKVVLGALYWYISWEWGKVRGGGGGGEREKGKRKTKEKRIRRHKVPKEARKSKRMFPFIVVVVIANESRTENNDGGTRGRGCAGKMEGNSGKQSVFAKRIKPNISNLIKTGIWPMDVNGRSKVNRISENYILLPIQTTAWTGSIGSQYRLTPAVPSIFSYAEARCCTRTRA